MNDQILATYQNQPDQELTAEQVDALIAGFEAAIKRNVSLIDECRAANVRSRESLMQLRRRQTEPVIAAETLCACGAEAVATYRGNDLCSNCYEATEPAAVAHR